MRPTQRDAQLERRYSFSDSSVSIVIAEQVRQDLARARTRSGPVSNKSARSPLASISHSSVRLPCAAASERERGGDGRLADAALAGDEEQPAIEHGRGTPCCRAGSA